MIHRNSDALGGVTEINPDASDPVIGTVSLADRELLNFGAIFQPLEVGH